MHGLVNQGIHDLAVQLGGEQLWADIRAAAEVDVGNFIGMDNYADDMTYRLVRGASSVLGITESEVLHAFGKHWILYTGRRGYGPIFDTMGGTLPEFLANLDAMHARLSLSMPELRPPSFVCEQCNDQQLRLEYWSDRPGLAPMVLGLLSGLGELFDVALSVTHSIRQSDGADHDEFMIDHRPVDRGQTSSQHRGDAVPRTEPTQPKVIIGG
jgi:hypothetical protein